MDINEKTALKIRQTRKGMEMKASFVATYLGLSESAYSKLENGKVQITLVQLNKIALCFDLSIDYLLS